jgi:hypothetical protein
MSKSYPDDSYIKSASTIDTVNNIETSVVDPDFMENNIVTKTKKQEGKSHFIGDNGKQIRNMKELTSGTRSKRVKIHKNIYVVSDTMCCIGNVVYLGDNYGHLYAFDYTSEKVKMWKPTTTPIINVRAIENTLIVSIED